MGTVMRWYAQDEVPYTLHFIYTLCLKKRPNFETILIIFGRNIQKALE